MRLANSHANSGFGIDPTVVGTGFVADGALRINVDIARRLR